jgi:hypothetical protein
MDLQPVTRQNRRSQPAGQCINWIRSSFPFDLRTVPFPPLTPRKLTLLCSTGSQVLRHSPTSPARACPLFGLWPLRTGLALSSKTCRRSPGSRACCSQLRGFSDYAGPDKSTRDYRGCRIAFLPYRNGVGVLIQTGFSKLNSPAHRYLLSTFQTRPRDLACKTRGQDGVAVSFPVGLFHPLQHAGLSRRTPSSPSSDRASTNPSCESAEFLSSQARTRTFRSMLGL